jgi:hypothetical protein
MKTWQWTIWLVLVALFLLNQYIERILHLQIHLLHSYFDDLLAVPITLGAYQLLVELVAKKKNIRISIGKILLCIVIFSFHFEILMPALSANYYADGWDICMYSIGGIFYLLFFTQKWKILFQGIFQIGKQVIYMLNPNAKA